MLKPKGILPAMITPFTREGLVNKKALRDLIDFVIKGGVHGIFAIGTTAEYYSLNENEYRIILEETADHVNNRVPVYAGANAITTRETIRLVKIATTVGVDAISVLTPMFITPNDNQLYEHYKAVANETDKPILLYNNAPKTGVNLSIELVERLADIDNIVGIKDSVGDFTQTGEYIRRTRGKEFYVMMGRDNLIYAALSYGSSGAVAASANVVPSLCVGIYNSFMEGDHAKALELQYRLAPLRIIFSLGTFPVIIKEALQLIGIDAGPCFLPISPLTTEERNKLKDVLVTMGVLV